MMGISDPHKMSSQYNNYNNNTNICKAHIVSGPCVLPCRILAFCVISRKNPKVYRVLRPAPENGDTAAFLKTCHPHITIPNLIVVGITVWAGESQKCECAGAPCPWMGSG